MMKRRLKKKVIKKKKIARKKGSQASRGKVEFSMSVDDRKRLNSTLTALHSSLGKAWKSLEETLIVLARV